MNIVEPSRDLPRTTLAVLFILVLIAASIWILTPFLPAAIWSVTIVVATWPLMLGVQRRLWGRRSLAVLVMTGLLLLVVVAPVSLTIDTLLRNVHRIPTLTQYLIDFEIPAPPGWLENLPLVGPAWHTAWEETAAIPSAELAARVTPYIGGFLRWLAGRVGGVGVLFLHFLLMTVISAVLYARGETAADGVLRFARRLAGSRGETAAALASQAIRAVALGVIVTAFVQAALGGIGLYAAGVPFPAALTLCIFVLSVAQLGAALVMLPAVVWVYWNGGPVWGTALLVYAVMVCSIDNFLRPILIRRGADLPLLLIFAGVIGGLIAFGVIGLFVGPVVLAVSYTLLSAWVSDAGDPAPAPPP